MRARVRVSAPHWSTVLLAALPLALAAFALLLQVLSPKPRSGLCTRVVKATLSLPTLTVACAIPQHSSAACTGRPTCTLLYSRTTLISPHSWATTAGRLALQGTCGITKLLCCRDPPLTLPSHRRANRDAGRVLPHVLGDRTGDAVPSLDWHAAAGQGVASLAKGRADIAPLATGNASKVSLARAVPGRCAAMPHLQ